MNKMTLIKRIISSLDGFKVILDERERWNLGLTARVEYVRIVALLGLYRARNQARQGNSGTEERNYLQLQFHLPKSRLHLQLAAPTFAPPRCQISVVRSMQAQIHWKPKHTR